MAVGERCTEDDTDVENLTNDSEKADLEIVTSSGRGKNGALCVLQNSIKPQIITSFGLSGCLDAWTVYDESNQKDLSHTFMVLAQESATMVIIEFTYTLIIFIQINKHI